LNSLVDNGVPVGNGVQAILTGAAPKLSLENKAGVASAAEGLGHHLLQVQAEENEPDTVNAQHDETGADREVLVLSPDVFGGGADLGGLKLGHDLYCLEHGHRGGEAAPHAGAECGVFVGNQLLEDRSAEVYETCCDGSGSGLGK
jgi:hypothetical protein